MGEDLSVKSLWSSRKYYEKISRKESFSHPGFLQIKKKSKNSRKILDIGCGDGSKLNKLGNKLSYRVGCELTLAGINIGRKKFPRIYYLSSSGENLPFKNNQFDLVVSLFVLEHTSHPEKVIHEIIRVTNKNGMFFVLAPNFGAPNRSSPNFKGSRFTKLISEVMKDLNPKKSKLNWNKVEPKLMSIKTFSSDLDTTIEPYQLSLLSYLENFNIKIVQANSYWEMELKNPKFIQRVFRTLGERGLFPFKHWGPHLFVEGKKL